MFPPQLHVPIMACLRRGHADLFKMRYVANKYFWWPYMDRKIQLTAENCEECLKSGKNLKFFIFSTETANWDPTREANQEILVDFLGPLPYTWGANKYLLICVDSF